MAVGVGVEVRVGVGAGVGVALSVGVGVLVGVLVGVDVLASVGVVGVGVRVGVLVGGIGVVAVGVSGVTAAAICVGVGVLCNHCWMIGPPITIMIVPHRIKIPVTTAIHIAVFDFEALSFLLMMISFNLRTFCSMATSRRARPATSAATKDSLQMQEAVAKPPDSAVGYSDVLLGSFGCLFL